MMYWDPELHEMVNDDQPSPFQLAAPPRSSIGLGTVLAGAAIADAYIDRRRARDDVPVKERSNASFLPALFFISSVLSYIADYGIIEAMMAIWPVWLFIIVNKIDKVRCGL